MNTTTTLTYTCTCGFKITIHGENPREVMAQYEYIISKHKCIQTTYTVLAVPSNNQGGTIPCSK